MQLANRNPSKPGGGGSNIVNLPPGGGLSDDPAITNPELARLLRDCASAIAELTTDDQDTLIKKAKLFSTAEERTHLPDSQVIVLSVAYILFRNNRRIGYSDVLAHSVDHTEKALSDRAIFAAFAELEALDFLRRSRAEQGGSVGRPRELFYITSFGIVALWMATAYAQHLSECRARKTTAEFVKR